MPGGLLSGETPKMESAANIADGVVEQILAHRARLAPLVEESRSHWRGTVQPLFEAKHLEWQQAIDRFTAELTRLANATRTSGVAYLAANDEGVAAMNAAQSTAPYGGSLGGAVSA
ncbi:WXG100 family type VII secretion target [Plantactinospora sp. WMMB782]|uniref:WXG100 family type VII secretion target n=1 Tax=Plantactinospora sp. WMMB782 TaxID=3404121 RepID=UPI003B948E6D